MNVIANLPLWSVFLGSVVVLIVAFEVGQLVGRRRRAGPAFDAKEKDELGSLVGAMLGLLGFILAIAFGGQLARFDSSKTLLIDEAAAIYEMFLRADMLPPAAADDVKSMLHEYAVVRSDQTRNVQERIAESEALQSRMWTTSIEAADAIPDAFPSELVFDSLNEIIRLHQQRVTVGISHRMPGAFWAVLIVLAMLSFVVAGYHGGLAAPSRSPVRPIVVFGFALLILLIADLDRQGSGSLRLNQAALLDVAGRMERALAPEAR